MSPAGLGDTICNGHGHRDGPPDNIARLFSLQTPISSCVTICYMVYLNQKDIYENR